MTLIIIFGFFGEIFLVHYYTYPFLSLPSLASEVLPRRITIDNLDKHNILWKVGVRCEFQFNIFIFDNNCRASSPFKYLTLD